MNADIPFSSIPRDQPVEAMTSLERVMATINHQIPDRVPVDLHNFLTTLAYAGYSMDEALQKL